MKSQRSKGWAVYRRNALVFSAVWLPLSIALGLKVLDAEDTAQGPMEVVGWLKFISNILFFPMGLIWDRASRHLSDPLTAAIGLAGIVLNGVFWAVILTFLAKFGASIV